MLAIFYGTLLLAGCGKDSPEAKGAPGGSSPPVSVAPVTKWVVQEFDEFSARLEAIDTVDIRARVAGTLDKIHFAEGQKVNKGDTLFTIDPRPFALEVARVEARIAATRTQWGLAKSELARAEQLLPMQAISLQEVDQLRAAVRNGETSIQAAQAELNTAKLNRDALYLRNYGQLRVRDDLLRIPGMGTVLLFGAGDYAMHVWINPHELAARNLTAGEVIAAIREQNVQVAAGVVGAPPAPKGTDFQLQINTQGRLSTEEEFADVIVRADPATGALVRIKDIGRVEISSNTYALRSLLNNKEAAAIAVFQAPGSNALALSNNVRAAMERAKKDFPPGVQYSIVYDPTRFVQSSIEKVVTTLIEAVLLVVINFFQTWRASIIPLLAVPVSTIGTFAVSLALGFSINTLTLFGLILAIGIEVDDAIVVVENVERNIENGLTPRDATIKAMQEVSGPIIAIALVLCAAFVPLAFVPGLSGQFYKQFAVTIAISTVISAFNLMTLSPALSAILLRPHDAPKDGLTRIMDALFGWFFRGFNRFFRRSSNAYGRGVTGILVSFPPARR